MITRIWHGRTNSSKADEYLQFLLDQAMPDYKNIPGNLGAQVWRSKEGDVTHFYTVSWWKDLDSIKKFAGEDYTHAKYYDEDKNFLLEFEPLVQHHECYE